MKREKKLVVIRQHWAAQIVPLLICALFLGSGFVALSEPENRDTAPYMFILAVIPALYIFLRWRCNYLAVTQTKIIGRVGVLRSKTLSTPLSKVQGVSLSNGLMGKLLRYHTVTISSAGTAGAEYDFKCMARAQKFVDKINELS